VTDQGQAMGSLSDMYFDDESGRIEGFEVSGGLLGDIAQGTSFLPVADIDRMGPDVIFIRPQVGDNLESQVGGVQGALQDARTKVGDAATKARDNVQSSVSQSEPEQSLIGKRSGTDVLDDNGRVIVANGERIRSEHVEWAKQNGRVGQLTTAATAGEASVAREKAGVAVDQAKDNVASAWDRFQGRLTEMRDEQGRQADAAQTAHRLALIQDAIGRPVTKVILDRSDNVILDFGDIVTHQSIQAAFDNGMLDTLLASVHRAEIGFPAEQLMVKKPGSATVDKASGGATVVEELEQKVQQSEAEKESQKETQRQQAEQDRQRREQERHQRSTEREQTARAEKVAADEAAATASGNGAKAKRGVVQPS
jgi:hypothetical protein